MLTTSKVKVFLEIIMEHKKGLNKQAKACNQVSISNRINESNEAI